MRWMGRETPEPQKEPLTDRVRGATHHDAPIPATVARILTEEIEETARYSAEVVVHGKAGAKFGNWNTGTEGETDATSTLSGEKGGGATCC